jgi:putative transposase
VTTRIAASSWCYWPATRRTNWDCHAFCLMPNHHHVIVETHQDLLSVGLRQLNGHYAQAFNERHERTGHLFGRPFRRVRHQG